MICINNSHFIGGGIIALLVFYMVNREAYYQLYQKINDVTARQNAQVRAQTQTQIQARAPLSVNNINNRQNPQQEEMVFK